ncbi:MAG TPA: glycosyltransferase family 39 protein [Pyrinomonadaceae bacterium]|nr:glycosyltransferase family 39 protein [Pyrinomonadaceae bacterium]
MIGKLILTLCLLTVVGTIAVAGTNGLLAVVIAGSLSAICLGAIRRFYEDSSFIVYLFLLALAARMTLAVVIYSYELYDFFGPDALGYDLGGKTLVELWGGRAISVDPSIRSAINMGSPGWGMHRLTAAVYFVFGPSILYVQAVCCVIGAATSPIVYACARNIYGNIRVARYTAIGVALFPSFIIWSSQLLKDGLVVFFIVLSIAMVLELRKKVNYTAIAVLGFSLFAIGSLRFYIFYMVLAAVVSSFLIGLDTSVRSIVRRLVVVAVLGLALAFTGVWQNATAEFERFGTFERLKLSRQYAASASESGFADAEKIDVSDPIQALWVLPLGFAYLMFAPFPWQVSNFRQAVTLPETFLWWSLIPLAVWGLIFTLKNRLAASVPVLVFTFLLTLSYSVYQGNVGTAYRQRTQIQVFVFMFIAVGAALWVERSENQRMIEKQRRMR